MPANSTLAPISRRREPSRVDAGGRVGPQSHHLGMVLGDQLAHVGDHEDALVGPLLQHALDERGHHDRLAAGGGDHDQRMPIALPEVLVDRRDGGLLVGAKVEGSFVLSCLASLVRMRSTARRCPTGSRRW